MNFKWTILLIIIYVVWHIVSAILQAQARRAQQEKMREAAERRQRESAGHFNPVTYPSSPEPGQAQPPMSMGANRGGDNSGDDLVVRRKAQLEQLRNRRDGRRVGQPIPHAGLPTGSSSSRSGGMFGAPGSSLPIPDFRRSAEQDLERRQREEARRVREQQSRIAYQRQQESRARRERARRAALHETKRQNEPIIPPFTVEPAAAPQPVLLTQPTPAAANLAQRLRNRNTLRELFVLKELLDKPVSLREPLYEPL